MGSVDQLYQEFGDELRPDRDSFCFQNAIKVMLVLALKDPSLPARIYEVNTPKGIHAYLVYRNEVYNKGITWPNNFYPDYSLEEIQKVGIDRTHTLLRQITGKEDDQYNYGSFVERRLPAELLHLPKRLLKRE